MTFEEWWNTKYYPARCKGNCKEAFNAGYETGKDEAEADLATVAYMQGAEHYKKELAKRAEQIEALNKDKDYFSDALDKQIEATYKVVEENNELKEKLNKAKEILKVVLNKWKEERWILQSEKEVKMIENVMKEAEEFLKED